MNFAQVRTSVERLLGPPSTHLTLATVLEEEERHLSEPHPPDALAGSDNARLRGVLDRRHAVNRSALCLSGGGIRSASFAIGVMQGLACLGLLTDFDYLSTVSGGGYAGSWLSAWLLHDENRKERRECGRMSVADQLAGACVAPTTPEPEPLRYLREFSRYLDPKIGLFSIDVWTLVATVFRNLLANWLILLPLLAAAMLMPRLYYALLDLGAQNNPALYRDRLVGASTLLVVATGISGIVALRYVIVNLPSHGTSKGTQAQFLVWCLAPSLTSATLMTLYWAWDHELTGTKVSTLALIGSVVAIHIGVWLIWGKNHGRKPLTWLGAALASAVVGGGLWLIEHHIFPNPLDNAPLYTAAALPLVLLTVAVAGTIYVAVAAAEIEDDDYEWWARGGAWLLVAGTAWLAGGAVVFFGPAVMHAVAGQLMRFNLTGPQAKFLVTAVTALSGGAAARAVGPGAGKKLSKTRCVVFAMAAPTFVVLALAILSWGNVALLGQLERTSIHDYPHPLGAGLDEVLLLMSLELLVGLGMSYVVNVNKFSLHGMYRARLIRTFLGASRNAAERKPNPFTGFDPDDNVTMSDLQAVPRPLHVINTALNVVSTNRLAWQDRKAESFTISPLHCGSAQVGYRPSDEYGAKISLGSAMTISGAAVSPNQGSQSSPALAFLLTLFNARLGAWLGNPGAAGRFTWRLRDPRLGPVPLLSEMFGRTTDTNPYVYLSDGGHFDNLGLYEMVLRRCHYIVVSDAGCDASYTFDDLGNAIRKIRIDLGIPIVFDRQPQMTKANQGSSNLHCAVATIDYRTVDGGAAMQGFLVYIKAALSGKEPMDVANYARAHAAFPHEPTTDQWFGESQFESYRALGAHAVNTIAAHVKTLNNAPPTIRDLYLAAESYVAGAAEAAGKGEAHGPVRV
jgi:Patatin-like phospholipase